MLSNNCAQPQPCIAILKGKWSKVKSKLCIIHSGGTALSLPASQSSAVRLRNPGQLKQFCYGKEWGISLWSFKAKYRKRMWKIIDTSKNGEYFQGAVSSSISLSLSRYKPLSLHEAIWQTGQLKRTLNMTGIKFILFFLPMLLKNDVTVIYCSWLHLIMLLCVIFDVILISVEKHVVP